MVFTFASASFQIAALAVSICGATARTEVADVSSAPASCLNGVPSYISGDSSGNEIHTALNLTSPTTIDITCVSGCTWKSTTGVFDGSRVNAYFSDVGMNLTGVVSLNCALVDWSSGLNSWNYDGSANPQSPSCVPVGMFNDTTDGFRVQGVHDDRNQFTFYCRSGSCPEEIAGATFNGIYLSGPLLGPDSPEGDVSLQCDVISFPMPGGDGGSWRWELIK
jgi:hypothetical protein